MRRADRHLRMLVTAGAAAVAALAVACSDDSGPSAGQTRTITVDIGGQAAQSGDRAGDAQPAGDRGQPPQVPGDESCDGARETITEEDLRQAEITLRCLTNAVRQDKGLGALEFDERLARAAATRSDAMAEANAFGHYAPEGSSVRSAVRRTGWIPEDESWLLGENIAWAPKGGETPAQIMRSWLDSETHRANILAEHFRQVGHGVVAAVPKSDAEAGATVTQVFGVKGKAARRAQTS